MGLLVLVVCATLPCHDIKAVRAVERDGVVIEEVRHHNEVAIGSKLVGNELGVDESMADHIRDASFC